MLIFVFYYDKIIIKILEYNQSIISLKILYIFYHLTIKNNLINIIYNLY